MVKLKYIALTVLTIVLFISCSEDKIEGVTTGKITGKVVMKGTNEPVENVKISTNPVSTTVFTDANGDFNMGEVTAQNYSVQAEKDGLLTNFEGVVLEGGLTVNVVFEMDVATANNKAPNTPVLSTPADNAEAVSLNAQFNWSGSDPENDTLEYTLTLKNNENNDELIFEKITDTFYNVQGLMRGVKYFWQVAATDNINNPVISEVSSFTTETFPNNAFAYVKNVSGNNVIYSSDLEGNEVLLTSQNTNSWRPRKNDAAQKIAYFQSVGGEVHIFTMNFDGSNKKQLTLDVPVNGFDLNEVDFSWSNNGSQIIYPNLDKLYRINLTGDGLTQIYQTTDGSLISEVDWSYDGSKIALKTNNLDGYNVKIFTIETATGNTLNTVLSGVSGAAGDVGFSIDGNRLLYTYDSSNFVDITGNYRRLDSNMFIYNFTDNSTTNLSENKPEGTNDLDARFSPTDGSIVFVNAQNDNTSKAIYTIEINSEIQRTERFTNAIMPDWE